MFSALSDIIAASKKKWYDYIVVEKDARGCNREKMVYKVGEE